MTHSSRKEKLAFYKLAVAHSDIKSALVGFRQIVERNLDFGDPMFRTLIFGSVVSYAKPFVGNKMYGKLSAHWERFPTPPLRHAHKELIDLRNQIVAHNDWEDVKVVLIPPGSQFIVEGHEPIEVDEMWFAVRTPGVHESRIGDYISVCEFIELAMLEKLGALKDTLFDASTLPCGPFDLEF